MTPKIENFFMEEYLKGIKLNHPPENIQILIAEDDDSLREIIQVLLKNSQRIISSFKNGQEAVQGLQKTQFDLVITDLMMPGADGMEVLRQAKERSPDCVVILITGYASLDSALQAIRGGAYDYIRKPFKLDELEIVVNNACEKILLVRENRELLQRLKETMDRLRRSEIPPEKIAMGAYEPLPPANNPKTSEMDVFLNQMAPPKYEISQPEPQEKTLDHLEKLTQLKKEGFIDALEFYSLKKVLLEPIRD
jgi:CheY-like chemotaxis protein